MVRTLRLAGAMCCVSLIASPSIPAETAACAGVDLVITEIRRGAVDLLSGGNDARLDDDVVMADVAIIIENRGAAPAKRFTVAWKGVSRKAGGAAVETLSDQTDVYGLEPGAREETLATFMLSRLAPLAGEGGALDGVIDIEAKADAANAVAECDEGNNAATHSLALAFPKPAG